MGSLTFTVVYYSKSGVVRDMKWVLRRRYWEDKASVMSSTEGLFVVALGGGEVPRSSTAPLRSCRLVSICAVLCCQQPYVDWPYVDSAKPYDLSHYICNKQSGVQDARPGPYVVLFVSATEYETSVRALPPGCHYYSITLDVTFLLPLCVGWCHITLTGYITDIDTLGGWGGRAELSIRAFCIPSPARVIVTVDRRLSQCS